METLRHQIARLVQRIMAYVKKLCKNKYILLWLGTHSNKVPCQTCNFDTKNLDKKTTTLGWKVISFQIILVCISKRHWATGINTEFLYKLIGFTNICKTKVRQILFSKWNKK